MMIASPSEFERLDKLREAMNDAGIEIYLVPHAGEHLGEYNAPFAQRLKWLTGFTGSAGVAIITMREAHIFVDGRYTVQVRNQVSGELYHYHHLINDPPEAWLERSLPPGSRLGFDPNLFTTAALAPYEEVAKKVGAIAVPCVENLIDRIWENQPPRPKAPASIYPDSFAGRSGVEKRALVAHSLQVEGIDAFFISALDSIAWLFNIRGVDVPFTPLCYAYALIFSDGRATLFIDPDKILEDVRGTLDSGISLAPYDAFPLAFEHLPASIGVIGIDKRTGSSWSVKLIKSVGRQVRITNDPCTIIKARKSPLELDGVRNAHVRDGVALTRFLAWLDQYGPTGKFNEITIAEQLHRYRAESLDFKGPSFATICGAGPNGAIAHYRASPEAAALVAPDTLLLIDSGGQYLDGTTDVTRTIAIGNPTDEQRHRFTLVLKGHIGLARTRFVRGTCGTQLDVLARHALWQEGLDYDHGTGHGVGTYLSVHEGPQRICKLHGNGSVALEAGMVLSNEPAYYKAGEYGIRIESLVIVKPCGENEALENELLEFETITMAPIDLNLIESSALSDDEIEWLNSYHQRVYDTLSPLLDEETQAWLRNSTRAIAGGTTL